MSDGAEVDDAVAFHRAMVEIYERAKREASYNATYFLRMVSDLGGLETARQLLRGRAVSDGFAALWKEINEVFILEDGA